MRAIAVDDPVDLHEHRAGVRVAALSCPAVNAEYRLAVPNWCPASPQRQSNACHVWARKDATVEDGEFEVYRVALLRAATSALEPHGVGAATVNEGVADNGMWGIEIEPTVTGAASAYLAYGGGDEVTIGFAETHEYLWDDDPDRLAELVHVLLAAVFAGRFIEAGPHGDAFAKLNTIQGEIGIGAIHLPIPWRLRRTRTYAPYS